MPPRNESHFVCPFATSTTSSNSIGLYSEDRFEQDIERRLGLLTTILDTRHVSRGPPSHETLTQPHPSILYPGGECEYVIDQVDLISNIFPPPGIH